MKRKLRRITRGTVPTIPRQWEYFKVTTFLTVLLTYSLLVPTLPRYSKISRSTSIDRKVFA